MARAAYHLSEMGSQTDSNRARLSVSDPHLPAAGDVLGKNYQIEELIGRGGMGAVYRATHKGLRREFAVKVVSVHGHSPDAARRLVQEARTASAIDHDHIVDVTDLGHTSAGLVYVVMELLKGQDLAEHLAIHREENPGQGLPPEEVRVLGAQILAGLAAAHEAGIVHRDLKPGNIFLAERRGETKVKLLDFGMSKLADVESSVQITKTGDLLGTPLYMPPEQSRGTNVDRRADFYSLGVVFYEMLAGQVPFPATSVYECVLAHATDEAPALGNVVSDVPRGVLDLVHRCLEKEPDDRFSTAAELEEAWERAWNGEAPAVAAVDVELAIPERSNVPAAIGVGLLVVVLGALIYFVSTGEATPTEAAPVAPVAQAPTSAVPDDEPPATPAPEPEEPPPVEPATTRLDSVPTGASVMDGDQSLGVTPLEVDRPAEGARQLRVVLSGYRPLPVEIVAEDAEPIEVRLTRARSTPSSRPSSRPQLAPH